MFLPVCSCVERTLNGTALANLSYLILSKFFLKNFLFSDPAGFVMAMYFHLKIAEITTKKIIEWLKLWLNCS